MRTLQRFTSLLGWAALAGSGACVVLEAVGVLDFRWRSWIGDLLGWITAPTSARWLTALAGLGLGALALLLVVAQLMPGRQAVRSITIEPGESGRTVLTAPAIYRRIGHELVTLSGVRDATPVTRRRNLAFLVELVDSANARETAEQAREALTPEMWASLGIPPMPVDLTLTYRRSRSSAHRKEPLE